MNEEEMLKRIPKLHETDFKSFIKSSKLRGVKPQSLIRDFYDLTIILDYLPKPITKVNKDDLEQLVIKLNDLKKPKGQPYKPRQHSNFRAMLKKYCKTLLDPMHFYINAEWIRVKKPKNDKLPSQMLSQEDVERLIKTQKNPRNKALIALFFDSGIRIGEAAIKLKDIKQDEYGFIFNVTGKTGPRRFRIIWSTPYLNDWLAEHPDPRNPEAWLFPNEFEQDKPMNDATIWQIFTRAGQRIKLNKPTNPHNFRHSRATLNAPHLKEAEMRKYFGWAAGSDMPETYIHLSGEDVDASILRMNGIEVPDKTKKMKVIKCPRCKTINKTDTRVCRQCYLPLTEEGILEEKLKNKLLLEWAREQQKDKSKK